MFKKLSPHLKRGQDGERLAAVYLKQHGLNIITHNLRTPYGEIDLIAWDNDTLVFIEVRTRQARARVSAAESITPAKQRRCYNSAQHYLQQHYSTALPPCRFDAVCIHIATNSAPHIDWLRNIMT